VQSARGTLLKTKLAIDGGKPVRATWLPYGKQSIDDNDIGAVIKVLKSDFLTTGPAVDAFEEAVAEFSEMPYAVSFSSATAALHAVMALIKVEKGKRVVTTPNTFAATSNAVLYNQGTVEFQDVEPHTLNLDADRLRNLNDVTAVIPVDFGGNPCDYEKFLALKKQYGFRLINDASHSLGATYRGKPVGTWADLSIFSFHPVKSMTTGEGGLVVTKNEDEAKWLKAFRAHGISRTDIPGFYRQDFLGFNYRMTDIQAALGTSQLKKLPVFIQRRREIVDQYRRFFSQLADYVEGPVETKGAESAWHLFPLRLKLDKLKVDRDQFLRALHAENIGANVHYIPVHWHPYYTKLGFKRGICPIYEAEYLREVSLPLYPGMVEQDVQDVCDAIEKLVATYSSTQLA